MAETTWTEEVAEPPKKKGIPVWVWGCGGGCLLVLVLALIASVWVFNFAKDAVDPEIVWPKIAEVLPFDERPDYKVIGGSLGIGGYALIAEEKNLVGLLIITDSNPEEAGDIDKLFAGELESGVAGMGELEDVTPLTVDVKGRPCRALSYVNKPPAFLGKDQGKDVPILMIDLSRDPSTKFVMLQLFCSDGEADQGDVDLFFEPFEPWR